MVSHKSFLFSHIILQRLLAWVVVSSLANPVAMIIGSIAGSIRISFEPEPSIQQSTSELLTTLLVKTLAYIFAGSLIGVSQWLILRQFARLRFWVPATIIGFAFGMPLFDNSYILGWIDIPAWRNFCIIAPAVLVAISQAFLIYREGYTAIWGLSLGEASLAVSFILSWLMGSPFDSPLVEFLKAMAFACLGAFFSAIALLITFRRKLAFQISSNKAT